MNHTESIVRFDVRVDISVDEEMGRMAEIRPYYAAFLDLRGRLCVVVGGGKVAERKVSKLLESGARVRVVSPELSSRLLEWAVDEKIEWVGRPYQAGDVTAGWLVFAAANHAEVNRAVVGEAEAAGRLVNVVDDPEACTLTVPASLKRGSLHVAISTSGTNPSLARQLRQALEVDLEDNTNRFQKEIISFMKCLSNQQEHRE